MPPDSLAARSFGTGNSPSEKASMSSVLLRTKPVHWETVENLPFVAGPFHKIEKIQNIDTLFAIQFSTRPFG